MSKYQQSEKEKLTENKWGVTSFGERNENIYLLSSNQEKYILSIGKISAKMV